MKSQKEQIIEILKERTYCINHDLIADAILALDEQEEEKPTDEEIENFFKTHHFDNKNGHHYRVNKDRIFGAKAMRDNPKAFKK